MIFVCGSDSRRQAVRGTGGINGIDYLEVAVGPGEANRRTLLVAFVRPVTGPPPGPEVWRIAGGHRFTGLRVLAVDATEDPRVLRLTCNRIGDLSWYTLRLVADDGVFPRPPAGYDPALAELRFTFRPGCGSLTDCRPAPPPGTLAAGPPPVDYTAKDYDALRRVALDRMAHLQPGWDQAEAADLRTMLVEVLAYEADRLSYLQDALDTEGLLGHVRQRISMRRLARTVDYPMHDGCTARAFVRLVVDSDVAAPPAGTRLLTGPESDRAAVTAFSPEEMRLRAAGTVAFEVIEAPPLLHAAHSAALRFHTWGGAACSLPRGATLATLATALPDLAVGDLLLLSATPEGGDDPDPAAPELRHPVRLSSVRTDADPVSGQAVTEIAWTSEDALPFDLEVTRLAAGATDPDAPGATVDVAAAFANLVLADAGETVRGPDGLPLIMALPEVPATTDEEAAARRGRPSGYRPRLPVTGLSQRPPHLAYDRSPGPDGQPRQVGPRTAAAAARTWGLRDVRPAVSVRGHTPWAVSPDLLALDAADPGVTVEVDNADHPWLRFGNGDNGRLPEPGEPMTAVCTVGNGARTNVEIGALNRLIPQGPDAGALSVALVRVSNPLPTFGGTDPESIEQVRQRAPYARLEQLRCVTAEDYAARAARHPGVQRAFARLEWTGSWETVVLYVDRLGGQVVDPVFEADLIGYLETYRLMGHDLEVADPLYVPLELTLRVCIRPGVDWPTVRATLTELFSGRVMSDGRSGLFHPDRLTFGSPVDTGPMLAAAQAVPGVAWLEITDLHTLGLPAQISVHDGRLALTPPQIARLDNDPDFPDRGTVRLEQVTT